MAVENLVLHGRGVNTMNYLAPWNSNTRFNVYSLSKIDTFNNVDEADFTWGEARTTPTGVEIYALKSDVRLTKSNRSISVDLFFSKIFLNGPSKLNVFFDTIGSQGGERIQFCFYMFKPVAFTMLRTLIYKFSTYKHKRCNQVFSFLGKKDTPKDSYRNVVVDVYGPLNLYIVSYLHDFIPPLEPHFKYIGNYGGDTNLLSEVVLSNIIVDMGFIL